MKVRLPELATTGLSATPFDKQMGPFMGQAKFAKKAVAFSLVVSFALKAWAGQDIGLEGRLVEAMSQQPGAQKRMGDSGKAIQAYMRAGLVGKKPNQRADYTDYYLLRKPAGFLGHDLVVIEEEYIKTYVGCCVSPGVGISVKVNGSPENLVTFARQNRCSFTDRVNLQAVLRDVNIKAELPSARYATLSCRERDADR